VGGSLLDRLAWAVASRGLPRMSEEEWSRLAEGARELARDERGNVTMRCRDGRVAKTFSLKRRLSSGLLVPHARRFVRSGDELARRGVVAPRADGIFARDAARRHVVTHPWVEGRDLRQALAGGADEEGLVARLGAFVGSLHRRGVLFRSLHFANVLVLPDGALGLLDVVDVRFAAPGRALAPAALAKNLRQLLRYPEDVDVLRRHAAAFARAWREACGLDAVGAAAVAQRAPGWLLAD